MTGVGASTGEWRILPPDEARAHPAYGVGGWVAAIIVLTGFNTLVSLLTLAAPNVAPEGHRPLADWPLDMQATFALNLIANAALLVTALLRSPWFVVAAIGNLVMVVALLTADFVGMTDPLGVYDFDTLPSAEAAIIRSGREGFNAVMIPATLIALAGAIAAYAVWGARPNVTFRQRVRIEPAQDAA